MSDNIDPGVVQAAQMVCFLFSYVFAARIPRTIIFKVVYCSKILLVVFSLLFRRWVVDDRRVTPAIPHLFHTSVAPSSNFSILNTN